MKKWISKILIGCLGMAIVFTMMPGISQADYADEMDEARRASTQMNNTTLANSLSPAYVDMTNIASFDIETALMAVQSMRVGLLDANLHVQLEDVQRRNNEIAALNEQLQAAIAVGDHELADAIKIRMDSMSNSQQMDMLRLQSLSNKRNEAFDIMTNFIKKMQDSRNSMLSHMR